MIRSRTKGLFNAYIFTQSVALLGSFWIYLTVLDVTLGMELDYSRYFSYSIIALFGLLINLFGLDLASTNLIASDVVRSVRLSLRQVAYVMGALMFMLLLTKDLAISRLFLFTYLPLLLVVLLVVNLTVPSWLCRFFFSGRRTTRTLLIGPPTKVRRVRRWLKVVEDYGVEAVGLVTDSKQKSSFGIPVVGTPGDLPAILRSHSIHSVLLLEIPTNQSDLSGIVEACESAGTRLSAVNTLADSFMHSLRYFQHFGIDFVSLREEPLEDPLSRIAKRVVDIAISLPVVGLILPPLALFTAILHRVQSPGPLFYRQTRTGIRNERFEILKFRSMIATPGDEARQATEHDERLFPGARFLRRSSIDEFPQFLNVLRGDMSLVGPRPHMLEHDEKFAAIFRSYHVRSYVKPGLTGLAQIRGYRGEAKSDVDIKNRIECDIDYIERWSLILDLLIIVKTVWQIPFPPKTAY